MYQTSYPVSASPPYSSSPSDPYRSSPIAVSSRQSYAGGTFSQPLPAPPQGFMSPNGFSAIPSGQSQRQPPPPHPQSMYQQLSAHGTPVGGGPGQYTSMSGSSGRYHHQPLSGQYANGGGGYSMPPHDVRPSQLPVPPQAGPPMPPPQRHKGTLAPGQLIRVGENTVKIERYLSEGGYAHVYLTSSERPIYPPKLGEAASGGAKGRWGERGYTEHCLKRIAFEDDSVWSEVRKEIEVMKALPPSQHLIQYLDSTHARTAKGGHEVFILMEFCAGGGIIDFLNKRLRDRLKEVEILNIFTDVCEAVAAMHALPQPLLHRDLKIENVLSHPLPSGPSPSRPTPLIFKLCDFGSTTYPATRPPSSKAEADALATDLNRHTTLQYRSPEMVEPMLGWAVGLPSDVWALGVLLYKLCYYTTPFEEHGTLAIVNAKYTFPQYPVYSPRLQHLIASMLVEQPTRRPNVFEVLKVAHEMSGTRPEVDYSSLASRPKTSPMSPPARNNPQSSNLLDFTDSPSQESTPIMHPPLSSTVQPQRRGRPSREPSSQLISQHPSSLPPMPQPTSFQQSQSHSEAANAAASAPIGQSRTIPAPALQVTGEKPALPRLQITGEAPTQSNSISIPSSNKISKLVDAFGMPTESKAPSASSPSGFGDSFAGDSPSTTKSTTSVATTASKFGSSLRKPMSTNVSGFGDSFYDPSIRKSSPPSSSSKLSPQHHSSISGSKSGTDGGWGSPPKRNKDPSSSITENDLTFDQRFPSIETLSSEDAFTSPHLSSDQSTSQQRPSASRQTSDMANLNSPLISPAASRPQAQTRHSFAMINRTGGDLLNSRLSASMSNNGAPQARSTQVTGTAFKETIANLPSPSTSSSSNGTTTQVNTIANDKADYFGSIEQTEDALEGFKPIASPSQDLMDRDDLSQLSMPLLQPSMSTSSSTSFTKGPTRSQISLPPTVSAKPANLSVPSGTLLGSRPKPQSVNVTSNSSSDKNLDSWSQSEDARRTAVLSGNKGKEESVEKRDESSSDEGEEGPEEASGTGRRPASPAQRESTSKSTSMTFSDRKSLFERPTNDRPGVGQGNRQSPIKSNTIVVSATYGREPELTRTAAMSERERTRPQSMYATPSTGSIRSLLSPPASVSGMGGQGDGRKPSPGITKFNSMSTDTNETSNMTISTSTTTNPTDGFARPSHGRRSSINDIVSQYEAMNVSHHGGFNQGSKNGTTQSESSSLTRKPSVANKPAALRKPAINATSTKSLSSSSDTNVAAGVPSSPSKTGRQAQGPPPKISEKPMGLSVKNTLAPAKRHGDGPTPVGYSKSSSGRSFPISKSIVEDAKSVSGGSSSGDSGNGMKRIEIGQGQLQGQESGEKKQDEIPPRARSSSPDKQQPVNLLIEKWNKGEVSSSTPGGTSAKRGGYI